MLISIADVTQHGVSGSANDLTVAVRGFDLFAGLGEQCPHNDNLISTSTTI
jgi:hypothetical protein